MLFGRYVIHQTTSNIIIHCTLRVFVIYIIKDLKVTVIFCIDEIWENFLNKKVL